MWLALNCFACYVNENGQQANRGEDLFVLFRVQKFVSKNVGKERSIDS